MTRFFRFLEIPTYQLQDTLTGSLHGTPLNGNNDTLFLSTGTLTTSTTYKIIEIDTATNCKLTLNSTYTITVIPYPPTPAIGQIGSDSLKSIVTGTSYEWFLDGTLLPDNSQTIYASQLGTYKVIVTDNNCKSDTSAGFDYTGIDLRSPHHGLVSIYPNPTDEFLHVNLNESLNNLSITIKNLIGKSILSSSFNHRKHISLDMNQFKSGLYFMHIGTGDKTIVFKIIKE